jgi:hypothetical protein
MRERLSIRAVSPPRPSVPLTLGRRLDAGDVKRMDLSEMLAYPEHERDEKWLKRMVQFAIELESSTIPPYLTAYWSVKNISSSPAPNILLSIVLQEMLHMGIVCNLSNSLGQTPIIASPAVVPKYPGRLPGDVHPTLWVELKPLSKGLIADTFMTIEEPETASVRFAFGQTYPTIGAFYTAIGECIRKLPDRTFTGTRQLTLARPDFTLNPITTASEALAGIELIKEQGEGESGSPLYGPNPADMAHYYLFGQIYHEKVLEQVSPNTWTYTGEDIPFPSADEIYPMATVPECGYPESLPFDRTFTRMLFHLQKAWELGGPEGAAELTRAQETMSALGQLAIRLMETPTEPGGALTMGPCFRFVTE